VSDANVEIVQAAVDAYNAGDIDTYLTFCASSVEAYPDASFPEARPLHGRAEFRRWLEGIRAPWTVARWVVHDRRAVRPDRVLERGDFGGVGMGSGIETLSSYTLVYTIRNNQIGRLEFFSDHDEALKAAGLEP
jgi:ketosteroid isomerase-like protein